MSTKKAPVPSLGRSALLRGTTRFGVLMTPCSSPYRGHTAAFLASQLLGFGAMGVLPAQSLSIRPHSLEDETARLSPSSPIIIDIISKNRVSVKNDYAPSIRLNSRWSFSIAIQFMTFNVL